MRCRTKSNDSEQRRASLLGHSETTALADCLAGGDSVCDRLPALPHIGRNTPPSTVINLHFSFGIVILVVMAVRFVHRLGHPVPLEARDARPVEQFLAKTIHYLLYVILLVGPVLGWASASAHKLPVTLFGIVTLPAIAEPGAGWANQAGDIHSTAMWALLWLIGLHAVAALYHHVVRRDGTLRRMLPSSRA